MSYDQFRQVLLHLERLGVLDWKGFGSCGHGLDCQCSKCHQAFAWPYMIAVENRYPKVDSESSSALPDVK